MIRPYLDKLPTLHPSVFLADGAQVIGNVEIGKQSRQTLLVRGAQ